MRHEIRTEIDIEAPPDRVWAELADLDAYAGWNPFITRRRGRPSPVGGCRSGCSRRGAAP